MKPCVRNCLWMAMVLALPWWAMPASGQPIQDNEAGVLLAKLKIPEQQKSDELCPVHLAPSDPELPTWSHAGVTYRGHESACQEAFEQDPDAYVEKAAATRWVNNFIPAMSTFWCPFMSDQLNPGGRKKWEWKGIKWESCCQFCDEYEPEDGDFELALELLKERALHSYKLTGGKYVEGASSPLEGAMEWDEENLTEETESAAASPET